MSGLTKSLVFLVLASVANAAHHPLKMPSYLKACSRSDPNVNECAKRSGQAGIPGFINGDRKYKLANLNPLEILQLSVSQGTDQVGLKIVIRNAKLYGLGDTIIDDIKIDFPNKRFTWQLTTPALNVQSDYSVSGRILLLPITGSGRANVTLFDAKYNYTFEYTVAKKNGVDYMVAKNGDMNYYIERAHINFENLFNGDKVLGPQMNKFLNENWQDVSKELGPSIRDALSQVIDAILKNICDTVPYDEIFIP